MADDAPGTWHFGDFTLNAAQRVLCVHGEPVKLGARAFDLLALLIAQRHRVVGKGELLDRVWPGLVVEEGNLTVQMSTLRRVLGPSAIATLPGRGYRFTAALRGEQDAAAPPPAAARLPGDLSGPLPVLLGRDADLAALEALCRTERLVTVLGGGGQGKTLLARHLLARQCAAYAHGGCWVDLAPVTDPALLPAVAAGALGIVLGNGPPLAGLVRGLASLQLLLVLDNAEHLVEAVAALALQLLQEVPGVRLVLTSQRPLHLRDEHLLRLGPLSVPPAGTPAAMAAGHGAVAMFAARAAATQRSFVLDDGNVAAVIEVCRLLDGSPLAIELAAARLPLVGLAGLAPALQQRLRVLGGGPRDAPARQQSLRAALAWTCGLLTPDEAAAFRHLAVFGGPVDIALVEAVLGEAGSGDGPVVDALARLVDLSLVAVGGDDPPRYALLESPRALAREQLQQSGDEPALRARHARALAQRARARLHERFDGSMPVDAWHQLFSAERDEVRLALDWAATHDTLAALPLAALLAFLGRNDPETVQVPLVQTLERLLATPEADSAAGAELAAVATLHLAWMRQDLEPVPAAARAAVAARRFALLARPREQYLALLVQALASARTDTPQALAALQAALALEEPAWSSALRSEGAGAEAKVAHFAGDHARSRAALQREVRARQAGGQAAHAALSNLIMVERSGGDIAAALRLGQELVGRLAGTRAERTLNYARLNLTGAALQAGDRALARATIASAWPAVPHFGLYRSWLQRLARLARDEGRPQSAVRLAYAALAVGDAGQVPDAAEGIALCASLVAEGAACWPPERCRQLQQEGALLRPDEALALGLATEDR